MAPRRQSVAAVVLAVLSALGSSDGGAATASASASGFGFVEQPRDHFDPLSGASWQQAFFVNENQWESGSDAPVFLCVGGEGPPIDASAVTDASVHCSNAAAWLPETKALMFALEHRYYGCHNRSACPVAALKTADDFRFLSSMQAVEDVARFQGAMSRKYNLTASNRWVLWGGSYPGMVAAFSRLKYPNKFHAAVASSAPVQARLEMGGYYDVVAAAYGTPSVGGSAACQGRIARGHARIGELLGEVRTRRGVEADFGLPANALDTKAAQAEFAGVGVASFPAQSNDPLCKELACNIAKICRYLLVDAADTDDVAALAALRREQRLGDFASGTMRQEMARALREEEKGEEEEEKGGGMSAPRPWLPRLGGVGGVGGDEDKSWTFQVCTEFGFLQTCDVGSSCMFTQGLVDLEYMFEQACGASSPWSAGTFSMRSAQAAVERSNARYGGRAFAGSRVLWVNGSVDPWIALSVTNTTAAQRQNEQHVLLVDGASHHAWTHPPSPNDQPSVQRARTLIRKQVLRWIAEPSP